MPLGEVSVEQKQAVALYADQLDRVDQFPDNGFFFDLFRNKPLEKGVGGVVAFGQGEIGDVVDALRDPLLLGKAVFEYF